MAGHTFRRDNLVPPCRLCRQEVTASGRAPKTAQEASRLSITRHAPSFPANAGSKASSFRDIYCVLTIQSGATDWTKGEFVTSPSVPSEDLMPKTETVEDPKFATRRNVLDASTVRNIGCGVPTEPFGCTRNGEPAT